MNVLEAFEQIVELSERSNLNQLFFERAAVSIRYASRKLKLTPMQTVLLALFVDRSENSMIRISDIAAFLGCRTTRMLQLFSEVDALEAKHYLRSSRRKNGLSYRVPFDVLKSIRQNRPYVYEVEPVRDLQGFFDRFGELMEEKNDDELPHECLLSQTMEHLSEIENTHFARVMNNSGLIREEILLFIYMAHCFIDDDDDCIRMHDIDSLYDDDKAPGYIKSMLRRHDSVLFSNKLIEHANEDGMASPDCFKLTEYAKTDVLSELGLQARIRMNHRLINSESFPKKELVYNAAEKGQVDGLASILSAERFQAVQSRLRDAGMRTGFCSLFYGEPGTGKTETVYQIARATGRDILQVDVDKVKSCWVGQSEQNIKEIFDRYRNICQNTSHVPILLFNEADAILGVRMEGAVRAVDKMENSIQNIILQEMETLEGILIATTNLTSNLDKAFERRFLYKIQFSRPTVEARARIWKIMMPSLRKKDARALASQFDLSGGEIENIVRKYMVNAILTGNDAIDLPSITDFCRNERIASSAQSRPQIGFRQE